MRPWYPAPPKRPWPKPLAGFRVKIVRCGTAYGVCFCHLKEKTGLSAPTVSHHLRILREAGLVEGVRVGRWTYYRLRPGALEALAHELLRLADRSRKALEAEKVG